MVRQTVIGCKAAKSYGKLRILLAAIQYQTETPARPLYRQHRQTYFKAVCLRIRQLRIDHSFFTQGKNVMLYCRNLCVSARSSSWKVKALLREFESNTLARHLNAAIDAGCRLKGPCLESVHLACHSSSMWSRIVEVLVFIISSIFVVKLRWFPIQYYTILLRTTIGYSSLRLIVSPFDNSGFCRPTTIHDLLYWNWIGASRKCYISSHNLVTRLVTIGNNDMVWCGRNACNECGYLSVLCFWCIQILIWVHWEFAVN